jgi:hypothetical protein
LRERRYVPADERWALGDREVGRARCRVTPVRFGDAVTVRALAMESTSTEKPVCTVPSWAFHVDFVSRPPTDTMSPLGTVRRCHDPGPRLE